MYNLISYAIGFLEGFPLFVILMFIAKTKCTVPEVYTWHFLRSSSITFTIFLTRDSRVLESIRNGIVKKLFRSAALSLQLFQFDVSQNFSLCNTENR